MILTRFGCEDCSRLIRSQDVPRADIFQVVFSIFRVGIFSSFSVFSLVSGAFTLTSRRVQRFVHWATRGRPHQSYGLRMQLDSYSVRVWGLFTFSSVAILPSLRFSLSLPFKSVWKRAARGDVFVCSATFRVGIFLHFSVFLVGGLSNLITFSRSAAIRAMRELVSDRNRGTG